MFPDFQLVAIDDADRVAAKINSIPFQWDETDSDLPTRGWDGVLQRGFDDQVHRRTPTAVSLLEARVAPAHLGAGLSREMLAAARNRVLEAGMADLFGPVRPARKAGEPATPMTGYAARQRHDGLPDDPWIRTHVRLGARVVAVCPTSMTISGTLHQWREWTGQPFDVSGPVHVAGGIVPVLVDIDQDHAVYVEPNVWVHHRLS